MKKDKLGTFILTIIFRGWNKTISIVTLLGIVGFFIAPAFDSSWEIINSLYIAIGLLILSFVVKIFNQYYTLFSLDDCKPRAIRIVNGDGVYRDRKIIVFSNNAVVSKNQILTMYCDSSGAPQPICLARVLDITANEIVTDQYPKDIESVEKYFSEEARKNATYITKNIDSLLLENQVFDGGTR